MKRLTKRINGYAHGAEGQSNEQLSGNYCRGEFEATACIDRLAAYEDTGFTPEQLTEAAELIKAKEEGRILPEKSMWDSTCKGKKLVVVMDIEAALKKGGWGNDTE